MVRRNDLTIDPMVRLQRQLIQTASASPLESSSVADGRVRFIGGLLRVESDGRVEIVGTLDGEGNLNWVGPESHKGTETHEGAITNTGTLTNNGATKLNGPTEVKGDLTVSAPGKIKVGTAMTLDPTEVGGAVKFSTGATIAADTSTNGVMMTSGAGWKVYMGEAGYALNNMGVLNGASITAVGTTLFLGGATLNISGLGLNISNLPTIRTASANNAAIGSLYVGTGTRVYRVIA